MTIPTLQQVFDTVARHLLTQRVQARNDATGGCRLRDNHDRKCAVGCLIPDGLYREALEGHGTPALLMDMHPTLAFNCGITPQTQGLLETLQRLHDYEPVAAWHTGLRDAAQRFGLSSAVLKEFPWPTL